MIINVSDGKANYSQRNNKIKPLESCNVTSMCMALDYLGYSFPKGEYEQPEDNLRAFIEANGKNPENHYQLSEFTNKWMGREVTRFNTARKISDILTEILEGRPVVISGTFPGFPTKKTKAPGPHRLHGGRGVDEEELDWPTGFGYLGRPLREYPR
jgi:uncharacterized protein YvpB